VDYPNENVGGGDKGVFYWLVFLDHDKENKKNFSGEIIFF
jgi:hypothetical protein